MTKRLLVAVVLGVLAGALGPVARAATAAPGDALTRAALSALAANDRAGVARAYEMARQSASDLAESILYLFNSTLSRRDEFLLAMETAARETQDPALRDRMLLALLEDEYYELSQLKGENRYNKFTRVFNRASSSVSRLALLQPQAAAQLLLDGVYSLRKARATTDRERQMAFLCRVFLEKHPDAPEAEEVRELQARLLERLKSDMRGRERLAGDLYRARGHLSAAEFHYENAALLAPDDKALAGLLESVRSEQRQREEFAAAAVSVAGTEGRLSREDLQVLGDGVRALLTGRAEVLARAAQTPSGVTDSVAYAAAAWFEMQGRHDAAIQQLQFTAASFGATPGGQAASALLANTAYNLDENYDAALSALKENRKRFILTGRRSTEDQTYVWGSAAIQSGGQGLAGLPALFLTDILVRGVAEHFKTQVETDLVVDAGARYIRRHAGSARSLEIAAELAQLCDKAGDTDRASKYMALAGGGGPDQNRKWDENRARRLMDQAMSSDLWLRKRLLERLVEQYGSTKIAATARKELARLHPTLGEGSVVLTRQALRENPGFAAQLGIPAVLLDGRKAGGEMAELGVAFDPKGERFAYQVEGGEFVTVVLPERERERLMAGALALADAVGMRDSGRSALKRQIVPVEIKGGAGGSGVELAPQLIPYADRGAEAKYFR